MELTIGGSSKDRRDRAGDLTKNLSEEKIIRQNAKRSADI